MIIIGENINGTRKVEAQAIWDKDAKIIEEMAQKQEEGGAAFLGINAGSSPGREPEDIAWLVNTVQEVSGLPCGGAQCKLCGIAGRPHRGH